MCDDNDYSILFPNRYTKDDPDFAKCSIDLPPPPVVKPWPPERSYRGRGRGRNNSFRRNDLHRHSYHGEDRFNINNNYRDNYHGHDRNNRSYHDNRHNGPYNGHRDRQYNNRAPDYRDYNRDNRNYRDNRDSREYKNDRGRQGYHNNRDSRYGGDDQDRRNFYHGQNRRQDNDHNGGREARAHDSSDQSLINEQQI